MKLLGIGSEVFGGIVKKIQKSEESRLTILMPDGTMRSVTREEAELFVAG